MKKGHSYGAQLQSYSACYGNTNLTFIRGSCSTGETIVMESVYVYAKPVSKGCPNIMTLTNVPSSCCEFDENDCGKKYEGEKHQEYYKNCDGQTTCITTPVSWEETPNCTGNTFLDRTNYMVANFYCVAENDIQTISGNSSTTDAEVFLWNTGYPDGNMTKSSSYSCSVTASCVSQLRIRALNLMLTSNAGVCSQSLTIKDGGKSTVVDCESNTDLIPVYIYDSESYYLEIEANNTLGNNAGKFFLLVTAMNPLANLTLACGTSKGKGYIQQADIPQCSLTTPSPTTPSPTTPSPTTPSPSTPPSTPNTTPKRTISVTSAGNGNTPTGGEEQGTSYTWIIIVVIIVFILLIIILILLFHRDKIKECCCKDKTQESDEKSLSSQFESPILAGFIPTGTQTAPRSTFKPNNVAPEPLGINPRNKLPPIALIRAGGAFNEEDKHKDGGEEDENINGVPLQPKRLPPLALFRAQKAFQDNLEKVKRRKKRLRRKKEALKRRESEIQEKEAVIGQTLQNIKAKERTLEKRLSGLAIGPSMYANVPQQSENPAPPQPLQRWSSILPSPSRNIRTLSALTNVVTAFRPRPSESVCIDVTNADDGKLVSSHINEDTC
ncbi:uncharacterized protein LOC117326711 [Pecten maximus]|uniref:uncharacterized protein LOC117326711 n=1 Tax=Pecten maximus TaxID=6579 RepID=UPI00145908A0|nr:uncharacterized protein LOC117326711 [Pecten maximus]